MNIGQGFAEDERAEVAVLFWQAFEGKLRRSLGPKDKAERFLATAFHPDFALCARDDTEAILGVAGFKTNDGALLGGGMRDLAVIYGWPGALWRGPVLELLERTLQPGLMLMDGIFVRDGARGQGVGSALLAALTDHARSLGCTEIRLDVIDTNPRARALYERHGFSASGHVSMGPAGWLFGFSRATTMLRQL